MSGSRLDGVVQILCAATCAICIGCGAEPAPASAQQLFLDGAWPAMAQWISDARAELEELEELDVEF